MTIGVDGNEANVRKKVGVSIYTLNLLKYFKKQANNSLKFIIYLRKDPSSDLPEQNSYFQYKVIPGKFLWSQVYLPLELYRNKNIDVFFSPAHYIPRFCPVPTVVTIHDLAYLYFEKDFLKKDLYQLKNWTKYSINKSTKIISVSKTTKNDIIKNYHVNEEKVTVIYNGFEKPKITEKLKLKNEKFILFVGTIQPRKNISTLIDAFNKFKNNYPEFKLLIVGKKGWLYEDIINKVIDLKLENIVNFTDFVADDKLIFLYKNAFCLVLPSFYEGFGLPILEAMSYGCPTIVSQSSSLTEIGGNSSVYFDPKNTQDLLEKLTLLKENPELRNKLIEKGYQQIKKFSWENCGKMTLEILKQAAIK